MDWPESLRRWKYFRYNGSYAINQDSQKKS